MRKAFRVLGSGFLTLAVLIGLSLSFIHLASELRGCNNGCHGKGVSGGEFWYEPWIARMVAPDLTRVAARLGDPELERVIRRGVRADGRTTWGMPSSMFYHLSDEDLGRIIAFIRSLPVGNGPETEVHFGPLGRIELLRNPLYAYAEEIAEGAPWMTDADASGEHGQGRYLALTVCTECHGMALDGDDGGSAPDLAVVAAYSRPAFEKLMATGVPLGGQKLGLMGDVARERFSQFTEDEVDALYKYLAARARGSVE